MPYTQEARVYNVDDDVDGIVRQALDDADGFLRVDDRPSHRPGDFHRVHPRAHRRLRNHRRRQGVADFARVIHVIIRILDSRFMS
jgi:hypothetical protein